MAMRALITSLAALAGIAGAAQARPFDVPMDHAAMIRLPDEASAIVVGNPSIADAMLYDGRTLFVTGKVYGRTNLIALDDAGRVIYTSDLVVSQTDRDTVEVFRNVKRETYVCAPECEATPAIGDEQGVYDVWSGQQRTDLDMANGEAGDGSQRDE